MIKKFISFVTLLFTLLLLESSAFCPTSGHLNIQEKQFRKRIHVGCDLIRQGGTFIEPRGKCIKTVLRAEPPSSSSVESSTGQNGPLDRPLLAALDALSLLCFAAVGKASHASDGSIDPFAAIITAFPFLVSWFATSFITGVYAPLDIQQQSTGNDEDDDGSKGWLVASWKQTAQGWIVAVPLGCVGRGLIKGYIPPTAFVIVTMIATLVILGVTRSAYNFVVTMQTTQKD